MKFLHTSKTSLLRASRKRLSVQKTIHLTSNSPSKEQSPCSGNLALHGLGIFVAFVGQFIPRYNRCSRKCPFNVSPSSSDMLCVSSSALGVLNTSIVAVLEFLLLRSADPTHRSQPFNFRLSMQCHKQSTRVSQLSPVLHGSLDSLTSSVVVYHDCMKSL